MSRTLRVVAFALRPLYAVLNRVVTIDPWDRTRFKVPTTRFGVGSTRDFAWYFERASIVEVTTIEAVCDWLVECEYVRDPDLFGEIDHWQHPADFEVLRKGDCEDHALWAWRKLTELGVPAEFHIGRVRARADREAHFHAWVVCRQGDTEYLLETTGRDRSEILLRLDDVRAVYEPHCAVERTGGAEFRTFAFGGSVVYAGERRK